MHTIELNSVFVYLGRFLVRPDPSGVSLKPLVFFFGFLAIIAVPQLVVHLLDAFVHARQIRQQPSDGAAATDRNRRRK